MIKKILTTLTLTLATIVAVAQTPAQFKFLGVPVDGKGNIKADGYRHADGKVQRHGVQYHGFRKRREGGQGIRY